jgi:hypothetical protein
MWQGGDGKEVVRRRGRDEGAPSVVRRRRPRPAIALAGDPHRPPIPRSHTAARPQGCLGFSRGGFSVNHMDIAPKYAGMVMGISNTAGTVSGVIGVAVTGAILDRWGGADKVAGWCDGQAGERKEDLRPLPVCCSGVLYYLSYRGVWEAGRGRGGRKPGREGRGGQALEGYGAVTAGMRSVEGKDRAQGACGA